MATDDRFPDGEDQAPDSGYGGAAGQGEEPAGDGMDDLPAFRVDEDEVGYDALRDDADDGSSYGDADEYARENRPDPGFAAFADDVDDPLADWPSPEARLEDLPEMRPAEDPPPDAAAAEAPTEAVPAAPPPADLWAREEYPGADDGALEDDDYPEAAFFDDPVPDRVREPAPEAQAEPAQDDDSYAAPTDRIDDDDASWSINAPRDDELPLPTVDEAYDVPTTDIRDSDADTGAPSLTGDSPTAGAGLGTPDADSDDDALVDDFLNDLDDFPESPAPDPEPMPRAREPEPDAGSVWAAAAGSAASAAVRADAPTNISRSKEPAPASVQAMDVAAVDPDGTDTASAGPPWIMIAVIVVALVLLGAGGYGVIQQRGTQQAEIRELQAQLATAMAPEEAAAIREQQRRIEQENEALASELMAVEGENRSLAERIGQLEAELRERAEVAAAAEAVTPEPAVPAAPTQAPEASQTPSPAASTAGWFVNFGSYASRTIADSWAGRLEVNSGRVVVQSATASGRTLYRVRVVDLASRDTAEQVATALEREHDLPRLWIGRD